MRFVAMPGIRQRWLTLSSRMFRVVFQPERGMERTISVVKVRGLLYPAGAEPDSEESQIEDWEIHPKPEQVDSIL